MLVSASWSEGLLLGEPGADAYKSCKIWIRHLAFIILKRINKIVWSTHNWTWWKWTHSVPVGHKWAKKMSELLM